MPLFAREDEPLSSEQSGQEACKCCARSSGYHRKWSEFKRSYAAGCPDCTIIVEGVEKYHKCLGLHEIRHSDKLALTIDDGRLMVRLLGPSGESAAPTLTFYVKSDPTITNPSAPIAREARPSALSRGALDFAKRSLEKCCENHQCHTPDPDSLPKRLLQISGFSQSVRLVNTSDEEFDSHVRYACLSYCLFPFKRAPDALTSRNLDARSKAEFRIDTWAFRDAVTTAAALDLEYLWIDSLCIVEDDMAERWLEIRRMGKIYSNAAVTIMAALAENLHHSFLNSSHFRTDIVPLGRIETKDSAQRPDVLVAEVLQDLGPGTDWLLSPNVAARGHHYGNGAPVDSRVWVAQEEFMSARVLRFDRSGVIFTCSEVVWTEDGFAGKPSCSIWRSSRSVQCPPAELWRKWISIVEAVSSRNVTNPRDIFDAMEGLATRYLELSENGDQYLAGIPRRKFIKGLAWKRTGQSQERLEELLGPSWSWVARGGPVSYPHSETLDCIKHSQHFSRLVDAVWEPNKTKKSKEKFAAFAILEGRSQRMRLRSDRLSGSFELLGRNGSAVSRMSFLDHVQLDVRPGEIETSWVEVLCLFETKSLRNLIFLGVDIVAEWFFLILQKSGTSPGSYERIGLWNPGNGCGNDATFFDGEEWLKASKNRRFQVV